jgi:hypothetical protein
MAQEVEHFPSKQKALSSTPPEPPKNKKEEINQK